MEILLSPKIFFFFFHFCYLLLLNESACTSPDDYFINCGSSANTTVDRRNFVGDVNPNSFALQTSHSSIATRSPSANSSPSSSLYDTARIFRQQASYDLNIAENGTYVVRFHFSAFTSQDDNNIILSDAKFHVSALQFLLLSNFSVQNSSSNSPVIKEFLLSINIGKFRILFTPSGSSDFAFVNAIEAFLAPERFIPDSATPVTTKGNNESSEDNGLASNALQVVHRINVGGSKITPQNDTLRRNWVPDDGYLVFANAAENVSSSGGQLTYLSGGATDCDAPDSVYNTAKELNISLSSEGTTLPRQNFNVSWRFDVNQNARFLVRTHFCNIVSRAASDPSSFNLYVYSDFSKLVDPQLVSNVMLAVPFYLDFVVDSDDSGFMNISIGRQKDSDNRTPFLNGVEIMELISGSVSIPMESEAGKNHLPVILGSVAGGVVLIIFAVVLFWLCLKLRKGKPVETLDWKAMNLNAGSQYSRSTDRTVAGSHHPDLNLALKVPIDEILYATKNFDEKLVIGEGGFGKVYRGTLRDGTNVAVKRSEPGRTQGLPEFQTEIMVLSKIRHRHLVSLIGYCDERSEMVLVYEFMEKGALRDHLYSSPKEGSTKASQSALSWDKRLEICIDAAKGLYYLHTGLGGAIIHRDVKSTNILLDEHYVAKVADFGISRLGHLDQSHVSTEVKGSFGYFDPEYYRCLQLTQKSDVYSFGVVLLEVLCARPAIDNLLPREQANLADWGMACLNKGELEKIIDPLLAGKIDSNSLRRFGETVEKCLKDSGVDRPNMVDVLWDLEYALKLQQTALPKQPYEDSTTDVSYNLPLPVINRLPSYSIAISEDEMHSETPIASSTNASEVFSQLIMDEAR